MLSFCLEVSVMLLKMMHALPGRHEPVVACSEVLGVFLFCILAICPLVFLIGTDMPEDMSG